MQTTKTIGSRINFHELRTSYKKGDMIFHENDMRDNAYIIEKGEVEISTLREGKNIALVRLGEGEVFGENALLGPGRRTATAVATEDTEVFTIPPNILRDRIMHLDPLVGLLMSLLVNRYRQWRYRSPEEASEADYTPKEESSSVCALPSEGFFRDLHRQKEVALQELRMAQDITQAIEHNEFEPYLQPIVSLTDQRIIGFEALVRWNHPTKGLVPPLDFIPVAERTNVIWNIDMMVLKKACALVKRLQDLIGNPERKFHISVNLSGVLFDSEDLAKHVGDIVRESGIDPSCIMVEVTEGALMDDPVVAEQVLRDIKAQGLSIALDDFGTGYSSLSYLHRFSIDTLKIDRSFVRGIHDDKKCMDIVRAIVALSKNFSLKVVAEGIESEDEIGMLSKIGCDYGQGYFFSRPMPADKIMAFVSESIKKNG